MRRPCLGRDLLDPEREVAVVRVAEVRDGDADEPAGLSGPEAPGVLVPAVAEFADGGEDPLLEVGPHVRAAREGPGHRHRAHAGVLRDLLDGRLLAGPGDTDHVVVPLASSPDSRYTAPRPGDARCWHRGAMQRWDPLLRSPLDNVNRNGAVIASVPQTGNVAGEEHIRHASANSKPDPRRIAIASTVGALALVGASVPLSAAAAPTCVDVSASRRHGAARSVRRLTATPPDSGRARTRPTASNSPTAEPPGSTRTRSSAR